MKTVNVLIIVLTLALGFATYLLVSKIMAKYNSASTVVAPTGASTQGLSAPSPESAVSRHSQPAVQQTRTTDLLSNEDLKLRPLSDIKVVMYMTDW